MPDAGGWKMRRLISVLLAGLMVACIGHESGLAATPPSPKLVVAISIDQFSMDLFRRYRPTFTGGLRRLSEGRVFEGYQSHGSTETCPGHSTLLTGDHPARTGIAANSWYDRQTGSLIYCVAALGTADPLAKSSAFLKVDTLGDWIRAQDPSGRVVSVSAKDRAAITMAGHHPTAVFWWNDGLGFGTSRFAGPADRRTTAPVVKFNQALFARWRQSPPQLWPAALRDPCSALEVAHKYGELTLSGRVPPESATAALSGPNAIKGANFAVELRASPLMDRLMLQMAERLIETYRLGAGPSHDLLAISFSATDYIGHRFGPGGAEMCAQMNALDADLGDLFAKLDGLGVPYVVVLSADHGAIDAPERAGPPTQRIDGGKIVDRLNKQLRAAFGLGYDAVQADDPQQLILNLPPEDAKHRDEITRAAVSWLKARPDVAAAYTADEVANAKPPADKAAADLTLIERLNESFDRERSGDILVVYAQYATLGVPVSAGSNIAGHGTPWDYDRRVPIIFWWPGVERADEPQKIETVDIAPTLAAIAGVKTPNVDGRCVELGQRCPVGH